MSVAPKRSYKTAAAWFVVSLLLGVSNDALGKYLMQARWAPPTGLGPWQLTWGRLMAGLSLLLPLRWYHGRIARPTPYLQWHLVRGALFVAASSAWSHGLCHAPLATATAMSFTIPIFILLLAPWGIGEKVPGHLWLATWVGLLGIGITLSPQGWQPQAGSWSFIGACLLFALLDVLHKRYVDKEPLLDMVFHSTWTAALWTLGPAYASWQALTPQAVLGLTLLGLGGNLMLYCLLRAFQQASLVSLAPLRYLEVLLATLFSYGLFGQLPAPHTWLGLLLIVPAAWWIVHHEGR